MLRRAALAAALSVFGWTAQAADVRLTGQMSDELRAILEGGSLLFEQAGADAPASPLEVVSAAQADYQRLLAVLYDQGYFAPVINIRLDGREAAGIPLVTPPGAVENIEIKVVQGSRFRFGRVAIAPVAPQTELPAGFQPGEIARLGVLRDTVQAGIDGWRDEGHAKAELESQAITANKPKAQLSADLVLSPGPRLRFGNLIVTGNEAVRTERIVDIAGLPAGEVYSPQELRRAAARLRRTGTFRTVALIEADAAGPGDTLPITAQLVEAKPRRFGFGAEVSTLEGLAVSGFWLHRNLLGGAERLRFDARISGIGGTTGGTDYLLGARFDRPATFNEDTDFYALAQVEQKDEVSFFSRQVTIESGFERIASENRRYRLGLGLRRGQTRDAFGDKDYTLFLVPAGVTFDYRDKALDARTGYFADVEMTPFLAITGADNGMLSTADLRFYRSFGAEKRTTLALRGQVGSLFGPDLSEAPADFLFYSGGGGTVRGHGYQSLGVELDDGQTVGGRSFLGLSAELRMRGAGSLGYVGFIDAGYIGSETFPDGSSGEWQTGAGVGLRYDTAIGPIRLDVAVPTSGPDKGGSVEVYIGIGQSF